MHAIILSRHDVREFDQRIVCYTREAGKREYIARGVKKITSKLSSSLEPSLYVTIAYAAGAERDYVINAEIESPRVNLRSDATTLLLARTSLRIVDEAVTNPESDPRLFDFLESWLTYLDSDNNILFSDTVLSGFIIRFMAYLGFAPRLDECSVCQTIMTDGYFSLASGGVVHSTCYQKPPTLRDVVYDISASDLSLLKNMRDTSWVLLGEQSSSQKINQLVRNFLAYYSEKKA